MITFKCHEKNEVFIRVARPVVSEPKIVLWLWRAMRAVNPSLGQEAIFEFYREDKKYWLIDDIGLCWSTRGPELEGHFTFWDGRLRGREDLIRGIACVAMDEAGAERIVTLVPRTKKMILAFLFRCGFTMESEREGMCKVYLLRECV